MESALAALLGAGRAVEVSFDPWLSLAAGVGASLDRLVRFAADEANREDATFSLPIVAARFADALLFKLLLEHPHDQTLRLADHRRAAEPRYVRMAAEYLDANAHKPVRMGELASVTGVSLRALQLGFLEHRRCSPTQFLKERRLLLARTRLTTSPRSSRRKRGHGPDPLPDQEDVEDGGHQRRVDRIRRALHAPRFDDHEVQRVSDEEDAPRDQRLARRIPVHLATDQASTLRPASAKHATSKRAAPPSP